jgi:aspartyl-tRNA(Asn)/glutamyl-tRNA(Gln) amidotransferase subunit A
MTTRESSELAPSVVPRAEAAFARIAAGRDDNIFTSTRREAALAEAAAADQRREAGRLLGPLDGRLVAVKDNLAVAGLPWTLGFGCFRHRLAEADALAVRRLKDAGAVILGTLNMHEGALGATTDNPHYGRCANPRWPGLTPGGSSGGSGAAVAAGLVDIALGSDTMGSVRLPAAYCGVAGFIPSRGLIGRSGLGLLSPPLDTIGPLAGSVAELRSALLALVGEDPGDPGWTGPAALVAFAVEPSPGEVRLGLPRQLADVACDPVVAGAFEAAVGRLRAAGMTIVDVDVAGWQPGAARRAGLLAIEAEAAALWPDLLDPGIAGVSESFKAMLRFGRDASTGKLVAAWREMRNAAAAFTRAIRGLDALILPTVPQPPFAHGSAPPPNQAELTALANLAGAPAVSLPIRGPAGRIPVSLQLVSPRGSDLALLALAEAVERALAQGPQTAPARQG